MMAHDLRSDGAKRWRFGVSSASSSMQNGSSTTGLARVPHGHRQRSNPIADCIVVGPTTIPFEPRAESGAEPLHLAMHGKRLGIEQSWLTRPPRQPLRRLRDERQDLEGVRR